MTPGLTDLGLMEIPSIPVTTPDAIGPRLCARRASRTSCPATRHTLNIRVLHFTIGAQTPPNNTRHIMGTHRSTIFTCSFDPCHSHMQFTERSLWLTTFYLLRTMGIYTRLAHIYSRWRLGTLHTVCVGGLLKSHLAPHPPLRPLSQLTARVKLFVQ